METRSDVMEAILNRSFLLVLCITAFCASGPARAGDVPATTAFFAASLWDTADSPVALSALRGKPLLVNFWATWCEPCRREFVELETAHRKHEGDGLMMVGIAVEDEMDKIREFVAARKVGFRILHSKDKGPEMMRDLGNTVSALPFTVAIGRDGRITGNKLGALRAGDLDRLLAGLRIKP
jgi:thiol-disulfide isomerase/thioredoxin